MGKQNKNKYSHKETFSKYWGLVNTKYKSDPINWYQSLLKG